MTRNKIVPRAVTRNKTVRSAFLIYEVEARGASLLQWLFAGQWLLQEILSRGKRENIVTLKDAIEFIKIYLAYVN